MIALLVWLCGGYTRRPASEHPSITLRHERRCRAIDAHLREAGVLW